MVAVRRPPRTAATLPENSSERPICDIAASAGRDALKDTDEAPGAAGKRRRIAKRPRRSSFPGHLAGPLWLPSCDRATPGDFPVHTPRICRPLSPNSPSRTRTYNLAVNLPSAGRNPQKSIFFSILANFFIFAGVRILSRFSASYRGIGSANRYGLSRRGADG